MSYKYWDYYLSLEADLLATNRFVDFSTASNRQVFSIEFARIILSACAEIDMVFKELCKKIGVENCKNITNYRKAIFLDYDRKFNTYSRKIAYAEIEVVPFKSWNTSNGNNPEWWRSYNKVKHERSSSFDRASLENALLSLAGLQIVLFEFYNYGNDYITFEYKETPKLIIPMAFKGSSMKKNGFFVNYSNS